MTGLPQLYETALAGFGRLVHAVPAGGWTGPTPCAEWDVRALVNHNVYEELWTPPLLAGETAAAVGDRFDGDVLGADPMGAWDAAASAGRAAWAAPGSWDRTVALSGGTVPASSYGLERVSDLLIHGWDLSRGIGVTASFDPELVHVVLVEMGPRFDRWRSAGIFGAAVDVPAGAGELSTLLAVSGRRPDWPAAG